MEKFGIETLKNDLVVITKVIKKVDVALEDDKFSLGEGLGLAIEFPKVFTAAKAWKTSIEELKDLSDVEIEELNLYFAEQFDLQNDDAEELVEKILAVVISVAASFIKTEELN